MRLHRLFRIRQRRPRFILRNRGGDVVWLFLLAMADPTFATEPPWREILWQRWADEIVVRLNGDDLPGPASFRLLVAPAEDPSQPPPTRPPFVIDGLRLLVLREQGDARYWEAVCEVPAIQNPSELVLLLPREVHARNLFWALEVVNPDGRLQYREPSHGWRRLATATLPEAEVVVDEPLPREGVPLRPLPSPVDRHPREHPEPIIRDSRLQPTPVEPPALRLSLRKRGAATWSEAVPTRTERGESVLLLGGTVDEVDWEIRGRPAMDGWNFDARFSATRESAFEAMVEFELPQGNWYWCPEFRVRVALAEASDAPGAAGDADALFPRYPLVAAHTTEGDLRILEIPMDEPRPVRFGAADGPPSIRATFRLATSPHTMRFPGLATFRLRWREKSRVFGDAFAAAWAEYQQRESACFQRRIERIGCWITDEWAPRVPEAARRRPTWGTGTAAEFRWWSIHPFVVEWPLDQLRAVSEQEAVRRLRFLAAFDRNWAGLEARTALLAGARCSNGQLDIRLSRGQARLAVNAHPNFLTTPTQPINRAMALWHAWDRLVASESFAGCLLEASLDPARLDANRAAWAVTSYPLTWGPRPEEIGLSPALAAMDFWVPWADALRERGYHTALRLDDETWPPLAGWADLALVPVPAPLEASMISKLRYYRAWMGPKPVVALLTLSTEPINEADLDAFFDLCLLYGLIPAFDGLPPANLARLQITDMIGTRLQTFGPWLHRLADAGWNAATTSGVPAEGWEVHAFGGPDTRWYTLRRLPASPPSVPLRIPPTGEALLLLPLTGESHCLWPAGEKMPVMLSAAPERTVVVMVIPWAHLPAEEAFLREESVRNRHAHMALRNLRACAAEREAGLSVQLQIGPDGRWRVRFQNRQPGPVVVSEVQWAPGGMQRWILPDARILSEGDELELELPWPVEGDGPEWVPVRWRIQRANRLWEVERILRRPSALLHRSA